MTSETTASAGQKPACTPSPKTEKPAENQLEALTAASIEAVRAAQEWVELLALERTAQKLSKTRVSHVARELREILKVLTRYCAA